MKPLEDDDDLGDDEDDERKSNEMLGLHHHQLHHMLPQSMNHQHPHMYVKEQLVKSTPGSVDCGIPLPASKPKIWSLADTAACKTPPPIHGQQQSVWCSATTSGTTNNVYMNNVRNGFISPSSGNYSSRYGYYSGSGGGGSSNFPDVQTDTPPQTPPNMKLPSVAGNLMNGSANVPFNSSTSHVSPPTANGYTQSQGHPPSHYTNNCYNQLPNSPQKDQCKMIANFHQQSQQYLSHPSLSNNTSQSPSEETAFKPFYKK